MKKTLTENRNLRNAIESLVLRGEFSQDEIDAWEERKKEVEAGQGLLGMAGGGGKRKRE